MFNQPNAIGYDRFCFRLTYLQPKVDCKNVTIPETNRMVLRMLLITTGLSAKQSGPDKMNGIVTVPPNINMYCY